MNIFFIYSATIEGLKLKLTISKYRKFCIYLSCFRASNPRIPKTCLRMTYANWKTNLACHFLQFIFYVTNTDHWMSGSNLLLLYSSGFSIIMSSHSRGMNASSELASMEIEARNRAKVQVANLLQVTKAQ